MDRVRNSEVSVGGRGGRGRKVERRIEERESERHRKQDTNIMTY